MNSDDPRFSYAIKNYDMTEEMKDEVLAISKEAI